MLIGINLGLTQPEKETPVETQFPNPKDVKVFTGFGADESDLVRGYLLSGVSEDPKYDKVNYSERYSQPRIPDEDQDNTEAMKNDFEFRQKEVRSRGFLTRPKIPTER